MVEFYRPRVASGEIESPSKYVILEASCEQLLSRKNSDPTRTRRNFEKHLGIIEPMKRYFSLLERTVPGMVIFLSSDNVPEVASTVV
jgi:adenylate kinase